MPLARPKIAERELHECFGPGVDKDGAVAVLKILRQEQFGCSQSKEISFEVSRKDAIARLNFAQNDLVEVPADVRTVVKIRLRRKPHHVKRLAVDRKVLLANSTSKRRFLAVGTNIQDRFATRFAQPSSRFGCGLVRRAGRSTALRHRPPSVLLRRKISSRGAALAAIPRRNRPLSSSSEQNRRVDS